MELREKGLAEAIDNIGKNKPELVVEDGSFWLKFDSEETLTAKSQYQSPTRRK